MLTPGVTIHVPSAFCVYEAAGTVIRPAVVANSPVAELYVYSVPAVQSSPLYVTVIGFSMGLNVSVINTLSAARAAVLPMF